MNRFNFKLSTCLNVANLNLIIHYIHFTQLYEVSIKATAAECTHVHAWNIVQVYSYIPLMLAPSYIATIVVT